MSKFTFFQQDVMQKIAAIGHIAPGTVFHISHRKYAKDNKKRDYEWGYTDPIHIQALRTSANALLNKGFFTIEWRGLFILTDKGLQYIQKMRAL